MINSNNEVLSNVSYSNEIFKQYLMQLSTGIIWKNTTLANILEPDDVISAYQTELFLVANRGLLNFSVVKSFPRVVLRNCGMPEVDIEMYASDKNTIPVAMRKIVADEYSKALCSKDPITGHYMYKDKVTDTYVQIYEEKNNYYRMLMGLPDINDIFYVYNTDPRWDTTTPIHELPLVDRIEMENAGVLDQYIAKYPEKKYLQFVGRKNIDFFTARIADRFEILYKNDSVSDVLNKDFLDTYNKCRYMVKSVYYNLSMTKNNQLYDNFMAMCILFMTLQYMQHKYLQVDITRDFYDVESLKLVYDSYSVPFYNEIPLDYHRKIVKNINKLISYKGSSKVFFDLFDIFDLGSMDIYSYFITKVHRLDSNGIPTFIPKKDEEGNILYDDGGNMILDPSNYTLQFSKVKIYDDPALSVSDKANDIEYEYLTVPDPYWIEDYDLQKKLSDESFNYLETKYIGIQTIFDLMRITYENAYIFRMITDNKDLTDKFIFRWTDIGIECSIFDLFIYLASLYCRYYHYEGIISDKIPAVMDTLGYDYENALSIISQRIGNDYIQNNKRLIELIQNTKLTNLDSVNTNYNNILEIQKLIIEGYTNSKTKEEFYAYRDLYDALLTSREITATYTDPTDGEIFDTFTDVLAYYSPDLMQRYLLLSDEDIQDEMTVTIDQLEKLVPSLRYLPFSAGVSSSAMIESLFKILKFFKSAKAELIGYNITYKLTMRGVNFFKMMDDLYKVHTESKIDDRIMLYDLINSIKSLTRCVRDAQEMMLERISEHHKLKLKDYILSLVDSLKVLYWNVEQILRDDVYYIDFIKSIHETINIASISQITDKNELIMFKEIFHESRLTKINDQILKLTDELKFLYDPEAKTYIDDKLTLYDKLKLVMDKIHIKNETFKSELTITDLLMIKLLLMLLEKDKNSFKDIIKSIVDNTSMKDVSIYKDFISSNKISKVTAPADIHLIDDALTYLKINGSLTGEVFKFADTLLIDSFDSPVMYLEYSTGVYIDEIFEKYIPKYYIPRENIMVSEKIVEFPKGSEIEDNLLFLDKIKIKDYITTIYEIFIDKLQYKDILNKIMMENKLTKDNSYAIDIFNKLSSNTTINEKFKYSDVLFENTKFGKVRII